MVTYKLSYGNNHSGIDESLSQTHRYGPCILPVNPIIVVINA